MEELELDGIGIRAFLEAITNATPEEHRPFFSEYDTSPIRADEKRYNEYRAWAESEGVEPWSKLKFLHLSARVRHQTWEIIAIELRALREREGDI